MEKKIRYIPRTEYIDGMSEVGGVIPYDNFIVFIGVALLLIAFGKPLFGLPLGILAGFAYHRFKRRFSRNFYLTIPYHAGIATPDGVPPVTEREFME